jgi:hypothetical protein
LCRFGGVLLDARAVALRVVWSLIEEYVGSRGAGLTFLSLSEKDVNQAGV